MKSNNATIIAVVVIFAIIVCAGLYAFTVWQKNKEKKNKAGYVDQDSLMNVMMGGYDWFYNDSANYTSANGMSNIFV